jgi:predicted  nucleic acid-binding Zn-ribbon protein
MINLRHECTACSSKFTVSYNELYTESDPTHCPFCGEYLILDDEDFDDGDLHDDEDDSPL